MKLTITDNASYQEIYQAALDYFNEYLIHYPLSHYLFENWESRKTLMKNIRTIKINNLSYLTIFLETEILERPEISSTDTTFDEFLTNWGETSRFLTYEERFIIYTDHIQKYHREENNNPLAVKFLFCLSKIMLDSWPQDQDTPNPFPFHTYYIYSQFEEAFDGLELPLETIVEVYQKELLLLEKYIYHSVIFKEFVETLCGLEKACSENKSIQAIAGKWLLEKIQLHMGVLLKKETLSDVYNPTEHIATQIQYLLNEPYEEAFKIGFVTEVMNQYEHIKQILPYCLIFIEHIHNWLHQSQYEADFKSHVKQIYTQHFPAKPRQANKSRNYGQPKNLTEYINKINNLKLTQKLDPDFLNQIKITCSKVIFSDLYLRQALKFALDFEYFIKTYEMDAESLKKSQEILKRLSKDIFQERDPQLLQAAQAIELFLEKNKDIPLPAPSITVEQIENTFEKQKASISRSSKSQRKRKRNKAAKAKKQAAASEPNKITQPLKPEIKKITKPLKVESNLIYSAFEEHIQLLEIYKKVCLIIREAFILKETQQNLSLATTLNNSMLAIAENIPHDLICIHGLCAKIEINLLHYRYTESKGNNFKVLGEIHKEKNIYLEEIKGAFDQIKSKTERYIPRSKQQEAQLKEANDCVVIIYSQFEKISINSNNMQQYLNNKERYITQKLIEIEQDKANLEKEKQKAKEEGRYYNKPEHTRTFYCFNKQAELQIEKTKFEILKAKFSSKTPLTTSNNKKAPKNQNLAPPELIVEHQQQPDKKITQQPQPTENSNSLSQDIMLLDEETAKDVASPENKALVLRHTSFFQPKQETIKTNANSPQSGVRVKDIQEFLNSAVLNLNTLIYHITQLHGFILNAKYTDIKKLSDNLIQISFHIDSLHKNIYSYIQHIDIIHKFIRNVPELAKKSWAVLVESIRWGQILHCMQQDSFLSRITQNPYAIFNLLAKIEGAVAPLANFIFKNSNQAHEFHQYILKAATDEVKGDQPLNDFIKNLIRFK